MSDSPDSSRPLTPREERASNNISFGDYIWKLAKFFLIAKGAAVVGAFAGSKIAGKSGAAWGYTIAGLGTAAYEGHQHWKPIKGTQERLNALVPEVLTELNPKNITEEVALQKEIGEGLKKREKLFTELAKKNEPSSIQPRGNPLDALAKEDAKTADNNSVRRF